jgi:hypothetical protein
MTDRRRLAWAAAVVVVLVGSAASPASGAREARPSAKDVVARVRRYIEAYRPALSTLVAEERYVQQSAGVETRTLLSDFAVVRADDGMWVGFRDVWSIDGRELPDRQARADRLFGPGRPDWASARRIIEESARFNLGNERRDLNTPIVALELLSETRSWCCKVRGRLAPAAEGDGLWVVEVEERVAPTLVRTPERRPVFARARYLVEPCTGAIRRSELRVGRPDTISVTLIVTFSWDATFDRWLPDEMTETVGERPNQGGRGRAIDGHAHYTRWRRFQATSRILGG